MNGVYGGLIVIIFYAGAGGIPPLDGFLLQTDNTPILQTDNTPILMT